MTNGTLAADSAAAGLAAQTGRASIARQLHRMMNGVVLVAVPFQFYAAGLAAFGAASFAMHQLLGWLMIVIALLSMVASLFARSAGANPKYAALLFLLVLLQPILAFAPRTAAPALSAVHPVVGLLIAVVAWQIERRGRS